MQVSKLHRNIWVDGNVNNSWFKKINNVDETDVLYIYYNIHFRMFQSCQSLESDPFTKEFRKTLYDICVHKMSIKS